MDCEQMASSPSSERVMPEKANALLVNVNEAGTDVSIIIGNEGSETEYMHNPCHEDEEDDVENVYHHSCSNCGIKLEPDNGDGNQLSFSSPIYEKNPEAPEFNQLLASYSVSVVEALSKVFQANFQGDLTISGFLDAWVLCQACSTNLKDLYILWNSFVTKTCESGILHRYIVKQQTQDQEESMLMPCSKEGTGQKRGRGRPKGSLNKTYVPKPKSKRGRKSSRRRKTRDKVKTEVSEIVEAVYNNEDEDDDYFNGGDDFRGWGDVKAEHENSVPQTLPKPKRKQRGSKRKKTGYYIEEIVENNHNQEVGKEPNANEGAELKGRPSRRKRQASSKAKAPQIDPETENNKQSEDQKGDEAQDSDFELEEPVAAVGDASESDLSDGEKRKRRRHIPKPRKFRKERPPRKGKRRHVPVNARPEVCLECGRRFLSKIGVEVHFRVIHQNIHGPFICDMENCQRRFKCHKELEHHMNTHLGLKPYICDQCGWATTGDILLKYHMRNKHTPYEEKELLKTKICEICGAKFIRGKDLQSHMVVHTDERPYHCSFLGCEAKFKLIQKLKLHEREVHLDSVQKYPCPRCNREFNRKHNLKLHMERHEKYDLLGTNMRKSRDPPIRNKLTKDDVPPQLNPQVPNNNPSVAPSNPNSSYFPPTQNYSIPFLTQL